MPVAAESELQLAGDGVKLGAALGHGRRRFGEVAQRPVRASASEAISSPTMFGSSSVPFAAA